MNKKALVAALTIAFATFALPAHAAFISGSVSFSGGSQTPTCDGTCSQATFTGIDFPAAPNALVVATEGDFSVFSFGTLASFYDIAFASPDTVWELGAYTFTTTSINSYTYVSSSEYSIRMTGLISADGYEDTNANLIFTGQQVGTSSWSASTAVVPVPASAALLGLGLLGMAGVARRRRTV